MSSSSEDDHSIGDDNNIFDPDYDPANDGHPSKNKRKYVREVESDSDDDFAFLTSPTSQAPPSPPSSNQKTLTLPKTSSTALLKTKPLLRKVGRPTKKAKLSLSKNVIHYDFKQDDANKPYFNSYICQLMEDIHNKTISKKCMEQSTVYLVQQHITINTNDVCKLLLETLTTKKIDKLAKKLKHHVPMAQRNTNAISQRKSRLAKYLKEWFVFMCMISTYAYSKQFIDLKTCMAYIFEFHKSIVVDMKTLESKLSTSSRKAKSQTNLRTLSTNDCFKSNMNAILFQSLPTLTVQENIYFDGKIMIEIKEAYKEDEDEQECEFQEITPFKFTSLDVTPLPAPMLTEEEIIISHIGVNDRQNPHILP